MAGGAGERFWPLSRPDHPKQLLHLTGTGKTMLEEAVERISPLVGIENTFISTVPRLVEPIAGASAGVPRENILAEPAKRNTAGALAWSSACLMARFGDEPLSLGIITADHRIEPNSEFQKTARSAFGMAETSGGLVTIGIVPNRPETGYGYIEAAEVVATQEVPIHRVKRFREKPQIEQAIEYLQDGHFYWNSGMFFWTQAAFVEEMDAASAEHAAFIRAGAELLRAGKIAETERLFEDLPNISIDYALMERARRVYMAEAGFQWDDLGSWDSLSRIREHDHEGNVLSGKGALLECSESVVLNTRKGQGVYALGIHDLVVVVTDDAVMICPKSRAQEVRKLSVLAD